MFYISIIKDFTDDIQYASTVAHAQRNSHLLYIVSQHSMKLCISIIKELTDDM